MLSSHIPSTNTIKQHPPLKDDIILKGFFDETVQDIITITFQMLSPNTDRYRDEEMI